MVSVGTPLNPDRRKAKHPRDTGGQILTWTPDRQLELHIQRIVSLDTIQ
jgi:hypothetical protein